MMEKFAAQSGDVDMQVEVMARDLAHPYEFLQIAEVLATAGRSDDALEWAQRGLIAFGDDPRGIDTRLDDFVLRAYIDRDQIDDALALVWRRFDDRPVVATHKRLRDWSKRAGKWDEQRPRARSRLQADAEQAAQSPSSARAAAAPRWPTSPALPAYQMLIEALLDDESSDEAWRLATEHGCTQSLWMSLASTRERLHPLDAIGVYQREIEQLVGRKQTHTYEQAVALIGQVGTLFDRARDHNGFATYVAELRHRHRLKTKFLGMLADAKL